MVITWKIKDLYSKILLSILKLLQRYHTPLTQILCELVLCWCVLHINVPDSTTLYMTGFSCTCMAITGEFYSSWHIFSHFGFPQCPCTLNLLDKIEVNVQPSWTWLRFNVSQLHVYEINSVWNVFLLSLFGRNCVFS